MTARNELRKRLATIDFMTDEDVAEVLKVEYRQAPKMTKEPCAWIYRLGNRKMYVEKRNGRLFIRNKEGGKNFVFWDSDPKVVEAVANLLLEASK